MDIDVDAVVVGAGLSGLVCAERLRQGGATVRVVEARDRVGGRTLSAPHGSGTFDHGGQWIGPGQKRVQALARELDIETFPTWAEGRHLLCTAGRRSTYKGTIPRLSLGGLASLGLVIARTELIGRAIPKTAPWRARRAREWDERTAESIARGIRDPSARAAFDAAVRTIFGAEASALSLLAFGWYTRSGQGFFNLVEVHGGAQERRFVPGAQALSLRLAERIGAARVALSSPVRAVRQSETGVEVVTERDVVAARFAVVAVPPALSAEVDWSPALPAARTEIARQSVMGLTIKVLVLYDRAFWRDAGLSGQVVFDDSPLSVVFDNTSHDGAQPGLVGFVVGQPARDFQALDAEARRHAVLESLARAFGDDARRPSHYLEHDWGAEPWTRGCPTSLPGPGALSKHGSALRAPCGRVHWAGTETASEYTGYLDGAIQAGERAAAEVLERLGRRAGNT